MRKPLRNLALAVALAVAAATGGCGGGPGATASPEDDPAAVARAFFAALLTGDHAGAAALVAYPLVWDSRCRVLRGPDELRARLGAEQQPPPGTHVAAVRPADGAESGLDPQTVAAIQRMVRPEGGCGDPQVDALLERAAAAEQRVLLVTLVVREEPVVTVVRVSRPDGAWRVTGIDN